MSLIKIGFMQIRIRFVQEQNLLNINGMKKIEVENVFMFNSKLILMIVITTGHLRYTELALEKG